MKGLEGYIGALDQRPIQVMVEKWDHFPHPVKPIRDNYSMSVYFIHPIGDVVFECVSFRENKKSANIFLCVSFKIFQCFAGSKYL